MTYDDLHLLAERMEVREIRAQQRRGENSSMDVVRVCVVTCPDCDDHATANCADTIRTFGAMHTRCQNMTVAKLA